MIDDLVTRGVSEPYRMFTSRAEFRLTLRADNADERLTEKGVALGIVGAPRQAAYRAKAQSLAKARQAFQDRHLTSSAAAKLGLKVNQDGQNRTAFQLLAMPDVSFERLLEIWPDLRSTPDVIRTALEADALYAGYAPRQLAEIADFRRDDRVSLPADLDYQAIPGLSTELRQKLSKVRPATLGQANRMEGMTPAALTSILIALRKIKTRSVA